MIIRKNERALAAMRESGRLAATVRDAVAAKIAPGVTTEELSSFAGEMIRGLGAESAFLGYREFPGEICISVNEEVVHGIPTDRQIAIGDIVSLDVGVTYGGYIGDTATTVMVGVTDPDVTRLVEVTKAALAAGIAQAVDGNRVSDISHAVETTVTAAGMTVVREFVGHGVGRTLHEEPQIPNFGRPGRGPLLKTGMTLAIEPMVNLGVAGVRVEPDGWTVVTEDRKMSAHSEHTVAVGEAEAEILTVATGT